MAKTDIDQQIGCTKKNEGFKTAGQVQYVAQTGNFVEKGFAYTGALDILKVALSYDYLWINLRVKGGAYGCMSGFKRNGESFLFPTGILIWHALWMYIKGFRNTSAISTQMKEK